MIEWKPRSIGGFEARLPFGMTASVKQIAQATDFHRAKFHITTTLAGLTTDAEDIEAAKALAIGLIRTEFERALEDLGPATPRKGRYVPTLRPAGFATLPSGVKWSFLEAPPDIAHMRPDLPQSRHRYGVIETDRELTRAEQERFDMIPWSPVGDGA